MIGVDIGTTSTKAVLYQETGEIISTNHQSYKLYSPDIHTAELDLREILQAVVLVIKNVMETSQVDPNDISFISFSSAMHSVIAIDKMGEPITNCITWADNRSSDYAKIIHTQYDGNKIYQKTGTPIHPMSPLSQIMWIEHEKPELARKTKKYIGIKEFIFHKSFQQYVVDYSIASCTDLMNLQTFTWDEDALKVAGISTIVSTQEVFTGCSSRYAKQMGILPETKFVIGASDGVLSNIGVNAIAEEEIAITIGTSGAIRTVLPEPTVDPQGRTFCYALTKDQWVVGGPINNGRIVLQWVRDE